MSVRPNADSADAPSIALRSPNRPSLSLRAVAEALWTLTSSRLDRFFTAGFADRSEIPSDAQ
jgi:hypothetical protein